MSDTTPSARPRWKDFLTREDLGRAAYLVPIFLGLAVISKQGPSGTQADPMRLLKQGLGPGRLLAFGLAGVVATVVVGALSRIELPRGAVQRPTIEVKRFFGRRQVKIVLLVAAAVLLIMIPRELTPAYQTLLVNNMCVYVLLALGLNVVVGFAGLLDLGYIAFFAVGAYSAAYWGGQLPVQPPVELNLFFVIPIAIVTAMIVGVLLGAPTLRLRGDYLAIVTLGFGEIVRITAVNSVGITNGPPGVINIPKFSAFGYNWTIKPLPYYYLVLVMIVIVYIAFRRMEESRVGRAWAAIREDEVAAAASGVATMKYKLMAFAIGASTAGLAGVFSASKVGFVSPANFPLLASILVLVYVIFGGMGSLIGVAVGAAFLEFLPYYLRGKVSVDDRYIYFGVLLILMMVFRPQGLIPSRRRARELSMEDSGADALGPAEGAV